MEASLPPLSGRLAAAKVTWALTLAHGISSMHSYTKFAWLPALLLDTGGQTPVGFGVLLALYSLIGLPAAIAVPLIVSRSRRPIWLFHVATASLTLG